MTVFRILFLIVGLSAIAGAALEALFVESEARLYGPDIVQRVCEADIDFAAPVPACTVELFARETQGDTV